MLVWERWGYRDMLLYGTQYEGNSMRGQLGVEVEPFEMLEMVREAEALSAQEVAQVVSDMPQPMDDS